MNNRKTEDVVGAYLGRLSIASNNEFINVLKFNII